MVCKKTNSETQVNKVLLPAKHSEGYGSSSLNFQSDCSINYVNSSKNHFGNDKVENTWKQFIDSSCATFSSVYTYGTININ